MHNYYVKFSGLYFCWGVSSGTLDEKCMSENRLCWKFTENALKYFSVEIQVSYDQFVSLRFSVYLLKEFH